MNTALWGTIIGVLGGIIGNGLSHITGRKKLSAESDSIIVKTALELIKELTEIKEDFERRLREAEKRISELEKENRDLHHQLNKLKRE